MILVTGDALCDEAALAEIEEAMRAGKELVFLGPVCAGTAALLQKKSWCPYGN